MGKLYELADGEELSREYPDTFGIPSEHERYNVIAGNNVKLIFVYASGQPSERMWVNVTKIESVDGNKVYTGFINNDPFNKKLKYRDIVEFYPKNIIRIDNT